MPSWAQASELATSTSARTEIDPLRLLNFTWTSGLVMISTKRLWALIFSASSVFGKVNVAAKDVGRVGTQAGNAAIVLADFTCWPA